MDVRRGRFIAGLAASGVLLGSVVGVPGATQAAGPPGTWQLQSPASVQGQYSEHLLLKHGPHADQVLVMGGLGLPIGYNLTSAQLFDPATGAWSPTGDLNFARDSFNAAATELPDGRVFVTGLVVVSGVVKSNAEVWDPTSGTWSIVSVNLTRRYAPQASVLPDGRVLIFGGDTQTNQLIFSTSVVDVDTNTVTSGPDLPSGHNQASSVTLSDGRILVVGGTLNGSGAASSTSSSLYTPDATDSAAGTWTDTPAGALHHARQQFSLTALPNDFVLAVGGAFDAGGSTDGTLHPEIWDPSTGQWTETPNVSGYNTSLASAGSSGAFLVVDNQSYIYDSAANTWTAGDAQPRRWQQLEALPSGAVLAFGGYPGPTATFSLDTTANPLPPPAPAGPPCSTTDGAGVTTYRGLSCFAADTGVSTPQYTFEGLVGQYPYGNNCGPSSPEGAFGYFANPLDLGGAVVTQNPCSWVRQSTKADASLTPPHIDLSSSTYPGFNGETSAAISLPAGTTAVLLQVIDGGAELPTQLEITRPDSSTRVIEAIGPAVGGATGYQATYLGASDPAGITSIRLLDYGLDVTGILVAPAPSPANAAATVPANGSVVTAPPTPASPIGVGVTTTDGGDISIAVLGTTATPPSGFTILGHDVAITAPDAVQGPLDLTFRLDASAIPVGLDVNTITLSRDGIALPDCPTASRSDVASWPCVLKRTTFADGDLVIEVFSDHASTWDVIRPGSPPPPPDNIAPTITITRPTGTYVLGQSVRASFSCVDPTPGSGLASCAGTVANNAFVNTSSIGGKSFTVKATDVAGNTSQVTKFYSVSWPFSGFYAPVASPGPTKVRVGATLPIVFSLGGYRGSAIFNAHQPSVASMTCGASGPSPSATWMATTGGLGYNNGNKRYTYAFQTRRTWAVNSCWQFSLGLKDGSKHTVNIKIVR